MKTIKILISKLEEQVERAHPEMGSKATENFDSLLLMAAWATARLVAKGLKPWTAALMEERLQLAVQAQQGQDMA